jgi:hypothetical protein
MQGEPMRNFKVKCGIVTYDCNLRVRTPKQAACRAFLKIISDLGEDYVLGNNIEFSMIDSDGVSRQYIGRRVDCVALYGGLPGSYRNEVKRKFNHQK